MGVIHIVRILSGIRKKITNVILLNLTTASSKKADITSSFVAGKPN